MLRGFSPEDRKAMVADDGQVADHLRILLAALCLYTRRGRGRIVRRSLIDGRATGSMTRAITTIGFDADDTLWQNERFFA